MEQRKQNSIAFIFMAVVFFLVLQLGFYYFHFNTSLNEAELIDTDTYMRLVRVEQLAETGDWYDSTIYRNNYPYGDTLHWTRPLDVILLAGAAPLIPWLGFKKALLQFGIVFGPLMGILSLIALVWLARPIMSPKARNLLLLIFVAQPLLFQVFMFGRPDHHSLLVLLFILLLGSLTHMLSDKNWEKYSIMAGLLAALSTWISTEAVFAVIMVFMALTLLWIYSRNRYAVMLRNFSLSLLLFSSLSLLIERPAMEFFSVVEYDKISVVYIFVYLMGALYSAALSRIESNQMQIRALLAVFLTIPAVAAIWLVFPLFFYGPMAEVNPAIVPIWLSKVAEAKPLLLSDTYFIVSFLGTITMVLGYLVYLCKTENRQELSKPLTVFFIGFLMFTALTFYQVRMVYCGLVIISILLALMLNDIINYLSRYPQRLLSLLRPITIVVFISFFPIVGMTVSALQSEEKADSARSYPNLPALCDYLNQYQRLNPEHQTVLAHLDFGPQILYRTDFNVIAGPYHRNDSGILYTHEVMTSDDMEKVKGMLAHRQIDLVVIAPNSTEKVLYRTENNPLAFYERLTNDNSPDWLKKLELTKEVQKSFIIYRVDR